MTGCCKPPGSEYSRFFNQKSADRDLAGYRRRGLKRTERDLVTLCGKVDGESVLEVGGGIGALQLELLEAGAVRATNVELSSAYEDVASALFDGREVERIVGDFVEVDVPPHDVVLMHRVVCCYHDVDALVGGAAGRARHRLALTLPQQRRWIGWGLGLVNAFLRLSGSEFRTYQHPLDRVTAAASAYGLRLERRLPRRLLWESVSFVR